MTSPNPRSRVFAQAVKSRIESAGRSVLSVAEATSIPEATLRRRLRNGSFTIAELDAIAEELGTTLTELVTDAVSAA